MATSPMRPVRVSARIAAPADDVFRYISDPRNDPEWCPNVERVELIEGDGIAIGTKYRFHQHLDRPRRDRLQFDVDLEVVGLGEHSIRWVASDRFQTRVIELDIVPEGDICRITQTTTATFVRPPGLAVRIVYPRLARRTLAEQFRNLAGRFDGTGDHFGATR